MFKGFSVYGTVLSIMSFNRRFQAAYWLYVLFKS